MIADVVSPVDHKSVPVAVVERTDDPQLSLTLTIGVDGTVNGTATPEADGLVHPLTVCVTLYVPAEETVMEAVVSDVDHKKVPEPVAVNTEEPQLSVTETVGATGIEIGAAVPEPAALVQPETVCVTVYDPAEETVIEGVVAPVDQRTVPVAFEVNRELPQLFVTVTTGVAGIGIGNATAEPAGLVHPPTV